MLYLCIRCRIVQDAISGGFGGDKDAVGVEQAEGGPCRNDHRRAVVVGRRACCVGDESGQCIIPGQFAATMGPEVHDGRPATGHGNRVAVYCFGHGPFARLQAEGDGGHALAAFDGGDGVAGQHADASGAGAGGQIAVGFRSCVDDDGDGQASGFDVQPGQVSVVIVGGNDGAVAGRDGEVGDVIADGGGQHDAGDVVSGERQRAFNGAGGGDDHACADAPEALFGATVAGGVVGCALVRQHIAVVVDPCPGGAKAENNVF